jgi:hypothetical protein
MCCFLLRERVLEIPVPGCVIAQTRPEERTKAVGRSSDAYVKSILLVSEISGSHGDQYEGESLWGVLACSLVDTYRRFGGAHRYCYQVPLP